jgi:hypothetical protein
MPYIKQMDRTNLRPELAALIHSLYRLGNKKGNLNYVITMMIKQYTMDKGTSYDTLSDITGVLNDVKTEFERKVVAPYEQIKEKENGPIYDNLFKTN